MPGPEDRRGGHPENVDRGDLEALAAARAELGPDYEPALLESFAERVEATIERRVHAETQRAVARSVDRAGEASRAGGRQLALGIASMVAAIPISIVLGVTGNLVALLVTWIGIVAVNWAHAVQGRGGP